MTQAVILVKISAENTNKFVEDAKKLDEVVDAYSVFGRFDCVVFVNAEDLDGVKSTARKLGGFKGVKSTETLVEG